ncbi:hypothetical protein pb186bvf_012932 [Paramecium bursaria]
MIDIQIHNNSRLLISNNYKYYNMKTNLPLTVAEKIERNLCTICKALQIPYEDRPLKLVNAIETTIYGFYYHKPTERLLCEYHLEEVQDKEAFRDAFICKFCGLFICSKWNWGEHQDKSCPKRNDESYDGDPQKSTK